MRPVAFTKDGPLRMGRLQPAAVRDHFAFGINNGLRDVKRSGGPFRKAQDDVYYMFFRRHANAFEMYVANFDCILKIAPDELHAPCRRIEPNPPGISRQPDLREGDEGRAVRGGFLDQVDVLGDSLFDVEELWRGLNRGDFSTWSSGYGAWFWFLNAAIGGNARGRRLLG